MHSAFVPLSCRAGKIFILQQNGSALLWLRSMRHFPTVLLHSLSAKRQEKTIRPILMQVQGGICCVMKQQYPAHYEKLHPASMSLANRKRCLYDLKEIGYQVGAGFMVGSPYQTTAQLICDIRFLQALSPEYDRYRTLYFPRPDTFCRSAKRFACAYLTAACHFTASVPLCTAPRHDRTRYDRTKRQRTRI